MGPLMIQEMGLENTMRQCLEAALPLLLQQISSEIAEHLPEKLARDAEDPYGWLSDGFENVTTDSLNEIVSYQGDGSINLKDIAEIASAVIVGEQPAH